MFHLTTALDAASAVPLYEQLYESLAEEMRTGAIPAGTRMPGKRRLAAELSVSVNTVDTAYQMLAAEGARPPVVVAPLAPMAPAGAASAPGATAPSPADATRPARADRR